MLVWILICSLQLCESYPHPGHKFDKLDNGEQYKIIKPSPHFTKYLNGLWRWNNKQHKTQTVWRDWRDFSGRRKFNEIEVPKDIVKIIHDSFRNKKKLNFTINTGSAMSPFWAIPAAANNTKKQEVPIQMDARLKEILDAAKKLNLPIPAKLKNYTSLRPKDNLYKHNFNYVLRQRVNKPHMPYKSRYLIFIFL